PPPPPHIYTLSLHDALPISEREYPPGRARRNADGESHAQRDARARHEPHGVVRRQHRDVHPEGVAVVTASCHPERSQGSESAGADRKSTRLNSSHSQISYAV